MQHLIFDSFAINSSKVFMADSMWEYQQKSIEHDHDYYEFIVVLNGNLTEVLNDKEYSLSKYSTHFLRPRDVHYFIGTNQKNTNLLRNIAIEKNLFEEIITEFDFIDIETIFTPTTISPHIFDSYIEKSNQLFDLRFPEKTRQFILKTILYDLIFAIKINKIHTKDLPVWLKKTYEQTLKDNNFLLGLEELIAISGKSQEHLTRAFKKYFSLTPTEFLNKFKLRYAARLLINTDLKIIDIIYESGFENISYFNRLFKNQFTMKPSEYRDINKKYLQ